MTTFSTIKYQRAHFKLPRGKGNWAFQIGKSEDDDMYFFFGTLTEAKKQASAKAKELEFHGTIHILG